MEVIGSEVKTWRPHLRQEKFLSVPDEVFEALYGGAAGGGKSEALAMYPLIRGFHQHPRFKGIILRRTMPELQAEIIDRCRMYYNAAGGVYNEQKKHYNFPSGARVVFGHAEHEQDIRIYDSAQFNFEGFDELTSFTEFQYLYLAASRCRSADTNLPSIVRSATNPGNIGHGWVRKRFIEPYPDGNRIIKQTMENGKTVLRIFIPAKLQDNPYLSKSDPGYETRLGLLPSEAERRAKRDGDWWTHEGQVFSDFRIEPFFDEPDNAKHIYRDTDFNVPDWYPTVLSLDWGYAAMLWAGFGSISPLGRVYIKKEYTCKRELISTWATDIGRIARDENIVDVVMCRSAWQKQGHEQEIWQQFQEYSNLTPRQADNDRIGGKLLFQEYLRWRPKPAKKIPQEGFDPNLGESILRIKGMSAYKEYCQFFEPDKPEVNLPKLQIHESCTELIRCIPLCLYAENNKEDVAEFNGDDPYDGSRYLLKSAARYTGMSQGEFSRRQQQDHIIQQFNEKKFSITGLYRKMELLEAREKSSNRDGIIHRTRRRNANTRRV